MIAPVLHKRRKALNMTSTARKILVECEFAHSLLESENDERKFKIIWIAFVSLIRSIGYVLDKVDSKKNPLLKKKIDKWWKSLKENKNANLLFWEFINEERHNILKEYLINIFSGEIDVTSSSSDEIYSLTATAYCPVSKGMYKGEDCRDVARKSIEWWGQQLYIIEGESSINDS